MLKQFRYLLFLLFVPGFILAQSMKERLQRANMNFENGNYEEALPDYHALLKDNPKSETYNYRIGVCYLNTNINKAKAAPYLENVTRSQSYDNNALYLLGRAYMYAYRFDDAIRAFNRFKDVGKGSKENIKDVEKQLQYCFNSKALIRTPIDVSFTNLGNRINSPYPDYFPFVPTDESFMIYNSKRADGDARMKTDGSYSPSAYQSVIEDGNFTKSKNISHLIDLPDGDEEVVGFSPDGKIMIMYHDDFKGLYNLYMLKADSGYFYGAPQKLSESVNSKNHEVAATINNEGTLLYFASDRPGGFGGTDIYMSKLLPNGDWGLPVNLGEEVNTDANEDFPNLTDDGKTLYFSSDGHTSMGGYDIFKVTYDDKNDKWSNVKNIGYPLNTPMDNLNFRISSKGRYGYISTLRAGGEGDLDIYRVSFNDVDHNYSVVTGLITAVDNTKVNRPFSYKAISIKVIDNADKEVFGTYQANPLTGRYVVAIPPGDYSIIMEHPGFITHEEHVSVDDKIKNVSQLKLDISLMADTSWKPPVLQVKMDTIISGTDTLITTPVIGGSQEEPSDTIETEE